MMKLTIKYEAEEIKALIREDLVRQGITAAAEASIVFKKDVAIIEVEATRDGTLEHTPMPATVSSAPSLVEEKVAVAPPLEVVDGGANNVDMSDVFNASQKLSKTEKGKYPPRERELMDGESYDHPHLK
jgi:hypothetical protein